MKKLRLLLITLCVSVLMGSMAVSAPAGGGARKRHVSSGSSSIPPANTGSTAVGAYRSTTTPSTSTDAA